MPRSVEISLFELHLLLTKQSWQISIVTLKGIKSTSKRVVHRRRPKNIFLGIKFIQLQKLTLIFQVDETLK